MDLNKSGHKGIDTRVILSSLWIARMLSSLQGDTARFSDPGYLKEMIEGTPEIPVTEGLVLMMSIVLAIPIFMVFLSLVLKNKHNRLANLVAGIFFVLWELVFIFLVYLQGPAYELFWGIIYLVFAVLIVGYAWRWPQKEP